MKLGFYRSTLRCPLQNEHMCYFQKDHVGIHVSGHTDWQYETIPLILHQDSHTRTHTGLIRRLTFQRDTHLWEYNSTKWNEAVVSLIASSSQVISSPMSHSYLGSEIIWCNVISFFLFRTTFNQADKQRSVKITAKRKDIKRLSSKEEENQYSNTKWIWLDCELPFKWRRKWDMKDDLP